MNCTNCKYFKRIGYSLVFWAYCVKKDCPLTYNYITLIRTSCVFYLPKEVD